MPKTMDQHMRDSRRAVLTNLAVLLPLAACGRAIEPMPPEVAERAAQPYRLAPGDRLRIAVFGHPDHTGKFDIDSSGNINFPLLGNVKASGRTVKQLSKVLTKKLNESYLVDPKVSVEVLNYRPFFILGEVESAGKYEYTPDLTVRKAVALAGGFTRRAAKDRVVLRRPRADGVQSYRVPLETEILPGDTIEVQRRVF